jgi:hypothetical protein
VETARSIADQLYATHNTHLLSLDLVAKELSVSEKTIRNQMALGGFPIRITRLGRSVRVSVHDLAGFLAGETSAPAPEKRGRGRPRKAEQLARRAAGGVA